MSHYHVTPSGAYILSSPIGPLSLYFSGQTVCRVLFGYPSQSDNQTQVDGDSRFAAEVCARISAYFRDPRTTLSVIPITLTGTPFQRRVWQHIQTTPLGSTTCYQAIALAVQSVPRAVGQACKQNPVPLLIPCHRVIHKSKRIGGFLGNHPAHIQIKEALLAHERHR